MGGMTCACAGAAVGNSPPKSWHRLTLAGGSIRYAPLASSSVCVEDVAAVNFMGA